MRKREKVSSRSKIFLFLSKNGRKVHRRTFLKLLNGGENGRTKQGFKTRKETYPFLRNMYQMKKIHKYISGKRVFTLKFNFNI
jgi:hypothetical protein